MRNFLERLKLLYRMQLKEYYEVIIAPDSKFSFEEHPKEQRAEMLGIFFRILYRGPSCEAV